MSAAAEIFSRRSLSLPVEPDPPPDDGWWPLSPKTVHSTEDGD